MRRRIVALLKDYPEGLTPAEIRDQLGVGTHVQGVRLNHAIFASEE